MFPCGGLPTPEKPIPVPGDEGRLSRSRDPIPFRGFLVSGFQALDQCLMGAGSMADIAAFHVG